MKKTFLLFALSLVIYSLSAQKYITKNGHIKFYSETPVETIEAHNKQVNAALDSQSGDLVFKVLMKSFVFEKALMQEHFNENYVESDKFPNAIFKGKVTNIGDIDFSEKGEQTVQIEGDLTIHGVTKKISETGIFNISEEEVKGTATFIVKPSDYDIRIPKTVVKNIAGEIEVSVDVNLKKYK